MPKPEIRRMQGTRRAITGLGILVALPCLAQTETTSITVRMFNRSAVAASVLVAGEGQSAELLRHAGIDVVWLNCRAGTEECVERPSATNLILTILQQGSAMGGEDVLGVAVQDASGSGTYGYVFGNKLNQLSGQLHMSSSRLLAYAMAHELGHLLKGSHSHSATGIMSARWSEHELEVIARGTLEFTRQDRDVMQSRLSKLSHRKQTVASLDRSR